MKSTKDTLFIDQLEVAVRIGTSAEERATPQRLVVSIRISLPLANAGRTDDLRWTVDYAELVQRIRVHLESRVFNLVEGAAESIAALALEYRDVNEVWVRVEKVISPSIRSVGAEIWRARHDA